MTARPPLPGSVLVANRGEIAVRVIATLRRLGIRAIAVYSDADAQAPHVRLADEAVALGPAPATESYLDVDRVLAAVRRSGAQAVHPGYGFLSERADVARACPVPWIGPPPEAIELLGDKAAAKLLAAGAGIATVPGLERAGLSDEEIVAWAGADPARLPLMVKAAAGGGGRGMRIVRTLRRAARARSEPRAARRSPDSAPTRLLAERYVEPARHVEIQVLADAHGDAVHLGERECSLQRRHQKVVEESPSPLLVRCRPRAHGGGGGRARAGRGLRRRGHGRVDRRAGGDRRSSSSSRSTRGCRSSTP